MKPLKRTVSLLLLLLLLCLPLSACGESGGTTTKDVPVAELADTVIAAVGKTDSLAESDIMFLGLTGLEADALGEHAIRITNVGTGIDQLGVFKAGPMSTDELRAAAKAYLEELGSNTLNESYFPEEMSKLDDAEIRAVGDYVMYCVMSQEDMATAFKAFENALK